MDLGLNGRTYLVTGATRGLGRACADALHAEGANVVRAGRSAQPEAGGRMVSIAADNADASAPARLIAAATEHFGGVDGAIVSVGGPPPGSPTGTDEQQWRDGFESVFLGTVRLCRELAEVLPEGGAIALVLSSSVRAPIRGLSVSNGLRPGLAMFAKDLADELGPRGIRVNGLLPGRIATDRVAEIDAATGDASAAKVAAESAIPLGRYGTPEEFARVAAFLVSPAASYVTGAMIPVDGGSGRSL